MRMDGAGFFLTGPTVAFVYATAENRATMIAAQDNIEDMGLDGIGTGAFRRLAAAGYPNGVDLPAVFFASRYPKDPRLWQLVGEIMMEAGINLWFGERPNDGFRPLVTGVNQPIGRPRRNLVGAGSPDIILSRASDLNREEHGAWEGPGSEHYSALLAGTAAEVGEPRRPSISHEMRRMGRRRFPAS